MKKYPIIKFHQFESGQKQDELIMFAARAKDIAGWAGIPRKGWNLRMLFQRPITPLRDQELKSFWEHASNQSEEGGYIVGPSAIIVAIQDEVNLDGVINLEFKSPIDPIENEPTFTLKTLAELLLPRVKSRLNDDQKRVLGERDAKNNYFSEFPDLESDYVFEFAIQMQQMIADAQRFIDENGIDSDSVISIIQSMEAVLRPAIVVDGQHRLHGAVSVEKDVWLPVIGIPSCSWSEQVYQFVVINEKAQKVDTSLLSDIFGSSLTSSERDDIRKKLNRSKVDIDSRIASVIANREDASPFKNMVVVKMQGVPPVGVKPYITDRTIRALIDGTSQKHSLGWRNDEIFYNTYVASTFPEREIWDSWYEGIWKDYWFAFWGTVRDFYNGQAKDPLWDSTSQTNLTKAVTLRQLQTLFMRFCIREVEKVHENRETLFEMLGDQELADKKFFDSLGEKSIPKSIDDFKNFVRAEFLERGVPVKFFNANWKTSLDDAQGQDELWEELEFAFNLGRKGQSINLGRGFFKHKNDG